MDVKFSQAFMILKIGTLWVLKKGQYLTKHPTAYYISLFFYIIQAAMTLPFCCSRPAAQNERFN